MLQLEFQAIQTQRSLPPGGHHLSFKAFNWLDEAQSMTALRAICFTQSPLGFSVDSI